MDGWSKSLIGLQLKLEYVKTIQAHLVGTYGYKRWMNDAEAVRGVTCEHAKWKDRLGQEKLAEEDDSFVRSIAEDVENWRMGAGVTTVKTKVAAKALSRWLHGRKRSELRMKINERVRAREDAFRKGEMKKALDSVMLS